ncbi:tRNA (N6-threonylcarbamoyladenosine(37)-N6)-methyltransferase TrmO [Vulcanisaeta thermophila]|uniref:tRNA (N6-threonylcarbamoyladenosine(37)-N6)-methyltransferase TrmO n=1 Tax=Vulcanisaeta thermophila TaxID=867917 RepID=UPI000853811B|nr:tRNA (N6-threonylcarbamoyladenosine(37)-N6)-methyltransferase TrmO [Vulcanisaeta thermophila]
MSLSLKPIGIVERGFPRYDDPERSMYRTRYEFIGIVRIYDEFMEGLTGLEEYSHVILIYWMHDVKERTLRVRLRGYDKEVGIFATRYPPRPNPIGVSVLELVKLDPPRLWLRGLDAWTGTPVIDLKPYDYYDIVKRPRVPREFEEEWFRSYVEKGYGELVPWLGPC